MLVSTATIHDVLLDFKIAGHYADQIIIEIEKRAEQIIIEIEKRAEQQHKTEEKAALNSIMEPAVNQNFHFYDPELAKRMQESNREMVNMMINISVEDGILPASALEENT